MRKQKVNLKISTFYFQEAQLLARAKAKLLGMGSEFTKVQRIKVSGNRTTTKP